MKKSYATACCLLGLLGVPVSSMNLNLARPWSSQSSKPHNPNLAFYSKSSDSLLFEAGTQELTLYCRSALRSIDMVWSLHFNQVKQPFLTGMATALPNNLFKIRFKTDDLPAGFYDLRVELDSGTGKKEKGVCTFGLGVEGMQIHDSRPSDFKTFWNSQLASSAKVPLDPRIESESKLFSGKEIDQYNLDSACLPGNYDPEGCRFETVESYKISYAGPRGERVYGWLAKPVGPGPFPLMLVLPGAGFAPRPRPLEHARHGYLALDIQIHGQDVDLEDYERIAGYYRDTAVYEPVEANYFRDVYLRAQRAIDYLLQLPEAQPDKLVAVGGSQGGRLAVVVAGLDPRVQAIVPCITNSGNDPHLEWVRHLNEAKIHPSPTSHMDQTAFSESSDRDHCIAYYDPMNFAPDVHCPVYMNAGLIDPISPAFSTWAVFQQLESEDKTFVPLPGLGHDWSAEFDRQAWRWLEAKLQ